MQDTAKYLVQADITADGVVERSDVVGAVFGQTEGLLGDELDLRELQDASKVGRIDVDVESRNGQSFGHITIATSLDQVETAILAAALETIDRVGPCRATIDVDRIEDVRAAKRREVVERAKTLLGEAFDESVRSSHDLVEEVRESVRVEDITDYEDLPAGPNVVDSDAIIVVEGRADVSTLLRYGVKNAVAVEGTNVPDAIAALTDTRTVTAFLDGDRGGDLILKELAQVGDVDYVAFAPAGRSVEDLERHEVMAALREKIPYDSIDAENPTAAVEPPPVEPGDGVAEEGVEGDSDHNVEIGDEQEGESTSSDATSSGDESRVPGATDEAGGTDGATGEADETDGTTGEADETDGTTGEETAVDDAPATLRGHVRVVVGDQTGRVRLLDDEFETVTESDAGDAFDLVADAPAVPTAVVLDGELDQRLLDVAAQRGVDQIVAASTGEFVKQPTSVRIRTADQLLATNEA